MVTPRAEQSAFSVQVNDLERELPSIRDEMSLMHEQAGFAPQPVGQRAHIKECFL